MEECKHNPVHHPLSLQGDNKVDIACQSTFSDYRPPRMYNDIVAESESSYRTYGRTSYKGVGFYIVDS